MLYLTTVDLSTSLLIHLNVPLPLILSGSHQSTADVTMSKNNSVPLCSRSSRGSSCRQSGSTTRRGRSCGARQDTWAATGEEAGAAAEEEEGGEVGGEVGEEEVEEEVEEEEATTEEGNIVHCQRLHPGWTTEAFLVKSPHIQIKI